MTRVQWMLNRETLTWSKVDKDVYDAAIRCSKRRKFDSNKRKYTTGYPNFREVLDLMKHTGRSCNHCEVEMDLQTPDERQGRKVKNFQLMTLDRVDTCNGRLIRTPDVHPQTDKGTMFWEGRLGYEGNVNVLCFGCNSVKGTVYDKYHMASNMLLYNTPEERSDYYRQIASAGNSTHEVSDGYHWAIARYIYGRNHTIPPIPTMETNECLVCGGHSSRVAWRPKVGWHRTCLNHYYSQWNTLKSFDRLYYSYLRENPDVLDVSRKKMIVDACDALLCCNPEEDQNDITIAGKKVASLFRDIIMAKPAVHMEYEVEEYIPDVDEWDPEGDDDNEEIDMEEEPEDED